MTTHSTKFLFANYTYEQEQQLKATRANWNRHFADVARKTKERWGKNGENYKATWKVVK